MFARLIPLVVASSLGVGSAGGPSSLLGDNMPDGFELFSDPPTDLDFDDYAEVAPEAVAHVTPESPEAQTMLAAFDIWTIGGLDIIARELTEWGTTDAATRFVTQAQDSALADGLEPVASPFEGAHSLFGTRDDDWSRVVTWRQGRYGVMITQFSDVEATAAAIDETSVALAEAIAASTGSEVGESPERAPSEPDSGSTSDDEGGDGGSNPILTVSIWIAIIVTIVLFVKRRKRRRAQASEHTVPRPRDTEWSIESARARARARTEAEAASGSDPTTDDRELPDDY